MINFFSIQQTMSQDDIHEKNGSDSGRPYLQLL